MYGLRHGWDFVRNFNSKDKSMKYPKLEPGEARRVNLATEDLRLACCDCGSVHLYQFHHIEEDVWDIAIFPQKRRGVTNTGIYKPRLPTGLKW